MATAEVDKKMQTSSREDLTKAKIEKILSMCDTTYEDCAGATAAQVQNGEMTSQERLERSLVRNYGSEDLFSLKNFKSGEIETVTMEKNTAPEDVLKETVKKIAEECSMKKKNVKSKPSRIIKDKSANPELRKDMSEIIDPKDIIDMCPFYGLENSEAAVDDRFHHKNTASMTNFFILNDLNISDVVWTYDEYMGQKPTPCPVSRRTSFWQRLRNHLRFSSHSRPLIRPVVSRIQKTATVKPTQ